MGGPILLSATGQKRKLACAKKRHINSHGNTYFSWKLFKSVEVIRQKSKTSTSKKLHLFGLSSQFS